MTRLVTIPRPYVTTNVTYAWMISSQRTRRGREHMVPAAWNTGNRVEVSSQPASVTSFEEGYAGSDRRTSTLYNYRVRFRVAIRDY